MSPLVLTISSLLLGGLLYAVLTTGRRASNLPAGPPTVPVLGNLHQIPLASSHFQFTEWARQYGGLYTLKLGTGTAAVITSRRLVKELLDKRSSKYSERPASYVAKLITNGDHILLMDYGAQWRDARKLLHVSFNEKVVEEQYVPLQEAEARQMIRDYLIDPEHHMLHPKRFSNSVTMSLIWGVRTPVPQTRHMQRLYSLMEIWSAVMETGATPPVDIYPVFHWAPQALFGNWVKRATHVQREMNSLYAELLEDIRMRRAKDGSRGSFMDRVLDQAEDSKEKGGRTYTDHELWFLGGTATEGGSDTTASMITAFVQAMVEYPDIQKRAQAEIDAVVGEKRSPTWQDYARLPYIAQCVKETMRWRPVTPLAFPHALAEDDVVDGKFLPKGTVIIINVWGLQRDPERFAHPDRFDPDHFKGCTTLATELANGAWENRDHYGYGAGRRFCPGAHVAERSMFLAMAKLLWAFDILPGVKDGQEIMPDTDPRTGYCSGFLVCAHDFEARFEVRGDRSKAILREFDSSKRDFDKYLPIGKEVA